MAFALRPLAFALRLAALGLVAGRAGAVEPAKPTPHAAKAPEPPVAKTERHTPADPKPKPLDRAKSASDPQRGTGTRSVGALPEAPDGKAKPVASTLPDNKAKPPGASSSASDAKSKPPAPPAPDSKSKPPPPVENKPKLDASGTAARKPDTRSDKTAANASHTKGRAPRTPAATLPANAARPEPDRAARQKIADGPSDEEVRAGSDDPELRSLREAERVLFPRPLPGILPGWSWDLPSPIASDGPEVVNSGVPPKPRFEAVQRDPSEGVPDAAWLRGLVMPNLSIRLDPLVIKYLRFYRDSASGKSIARVWAKKSGRYVRAIKAELAKAGLPTDLVWVSLIESGHSPTIVSPAGAAGLWQFMPEAGRVYGLTVDRWVDERLDPERATQAAGRYLSDLYRRFGTWELALAAYNMGYAGLARAIRKYNTNDFWELTRYEAGVPWETALYVPRIVATAIVMNNKAAFGLDAIVPDEADSFDVVLVGPSLPLSEVARAAGVLGPTIELLNPQYLSGRTPPSGPGPKPSFRVRVPFGKGDASSALLGKSLLSEELVDTYTVKFGDSIESIALQRGASEVYIRSLNRVDAKEVLAPGTLLYVPRSDVKALAPGASNEVVVVPPREFAYPERARVFYRVLAGDTLAGIAGVFGLATSDVTLWNVLAVAARLQPGMVLQLFVPKTRDLRHVRTLDARTARVLIAGSSEFYDYFEAQNGRKRLLVTAREGETLGALGRRYKMTLGSVERCNRRSRNDKLKAGESVVVYVDRGNTPAPRPVEPEALPLANVGFTREPAANDPGLESLGRAERGAEP